MRGSKDVGQPWSDALAGNSWREFEVLLEDYFRRQGYKVEHVGAGRTGGRSFDDGIDLKLRRQGRYVIVQCKHWNAKQVPHSAVHELLGIMVRESAHGAVLVTSGEFTPYAIESAQRIGNIELLDGIELRRRLEIPAPSPSWIEASWIEASWIEPDSRDGLYADAFGDTAANQVDGEWRRKGGRRRNRPPSDHQVALRVLVLGALVVVFLILWRELF
jgi:hypothetical protein